MFRLFETYTSMTWPSADHQRSNAVTPYPVTRPNRRFGFQRELRPRSDQFGLPRRGALGCSSRQLRLPGRPDLDQHCCEFGHCVVAIGIVEDRRRDPTPPLGIHLDAAAKNAGHCQ